MSSPAALPSCAFTLSSAAWYSMHTLCGMDQACRPRAADATLGSVPGSSTATYLRKLLARTRSPQLPDVSNSGSWSAGNCVKSSLRRWRNGRLAWRRSPDQHTHFPDLHTGARFRSTSPIGVIPIMVLSHPLRCGRFDRTQIPASTSVASDGDDGGWTARQVQFELD
jgi:hypothetical protein